MHVGTLGIGFMRARLLCVHGSMHMRGSMYARTSGSGYMHARTRDGFISQFVAHKFILGTLQPALLLSFSSTRVSAADTVGLHATPVLSSTYHLRHLCVPFFLFFVGDRQGLC
mmetsp:Transcript_6980/g.18751  ORF Transcript_6980/g.18751 Transcript_6980/m.18751 type:complete len:113 (-) Transcript_6980:496-834(-)